MRPFFLFVRACGACSPPTHLTSNALRNDLSHPNEYVRGSTLRFLCKLRETEIIEPCLALVRSNLVRSLV